MDRGWWAKLGLVVLVALGAVWYLVPSYYSFFVLERQDRNNLEAAPGEAPLVGAGGEPPALAGLDLQGGIHMVMRVDTKTALQKRAERRAVQIANYVKDKKLGEVTPETNPEKLEVTLTAADPATMDAIEKDVTTPSRTSPRSTATGRSSCSSSATPRSTASRTSRSTRRCW